MKLKGIKRSKLPKVLSTRLILLGVSGVLLVSSFVYMTTAWYTKMVSTSGLQFEAAQWEFSANFAVSDQQLNVYEYSTLNQERAAPGTGGVIPIELAAYQSDTDVDYMISIDRSSMSDEFRQRIFFYYMDGQTKHYLHGSPDDPDAQAEPLKGTIQRTLPAEDGKEPETNKITVLVYWEWVYGPKEGSDDAIKAWDDFDTKVGKNPEMYAADMNAELSIVGTQSHPGNPLNLS